MDPIVATYSADITVRSESAADGVLIDELQEAIEHAIEDAMAEHGVEDATVNAIAKRTDR